MTFSAVSEGQRVLVTGAHGFVGQWLIRGLRDVQPSWLLDLPFGPGAPSDLGPALDITDEHSVAEYIRRSPPDIVVHLAAISAVTAAEKDARLAWKVNLLGTLNLVEALLRWAPQAYLMHVSTAEVYGSSLGGPRASDEKTLLEPQNEYAASKAAADILVRQAAVNGLKAVVVRPFNHTGPGQGSQFVAPSFAMQIARIEAGLQDPVLSVGSLEEERDFLDVRDVVTAYLALLQRSPAARRADVYNICSGEATKIGELLRYLLAAAKVNVEVNVDPARLRKVGIPRIVGDARKIKVDVGWAPTIPLEKTLNDILEYERNSLRKRDADLRSRKQGFREP